MTPSINDFFLLAYEFPNFSLNSYPVTGTRAADDLPPIIMLVALLVVEPVGTVGPDVTLRWALGEEGGGGRRITDTTLCVCSHIRRNRRILPEIG